MASRSTAASATRRGGRSRLTEGFFGISKPRRSPGLFLLSSERTPALNSSPSTEIHRALGLEESIGATPLVELARFSRGAARIFAKLEWLNPGGSVKDRIARAMIEDAEKGG